MQIYSKKRFLYHIKNLCKKRGVRLTPQRLKILELISQQNNAISAYHLLYLLHKSSPKAKPSTIYRALKFFLSQGFIHKIESINSFMLCHYFFKNSHTYIFLICNQCKQVTEKTTNSIEKELQKVAKTTNFKITCNIIETHGICLKCTKNTFKLNIL